MVYNFNGRNIRIPDAEIENNMKVLELTKDEAIQLYLEANDYCVNEEVERLTQKAKENKAVVHGAKSDKPRKKRTTSTAAKERKPDTEKEDFITKLADFLTKEGYNPQIVNKSKLIEFKMGENTFKLDLIRKRTPKN
jgi:ABC-type nitrate/sulfonate/bicarbonate transport system substrate-binding protein